MEYAKTIQLLTEQYGIVKDQIFDFNDQNTDLYNYYNKIYNYCSNNLINLANAYGVEPLFYFSNDERFDACYIPRFDRGVYCLSKGYVNLVYSSFENYTDNSKEYIQFSTILRRHDASFSKFMFGIFFHFTFLHELRHQQQLTFNKSLRKTILIRHSMEFDSDQDASHLIFDRFLHIYKVSNLQDVDLLHQITIFGCASIICFFYKPHKINSDLYYLNTDLNHPHPIIRILYILGIFKNNMNELYGGGNISTGKLITECLGICNKIIINIPNCKESIDIQSFIKKIRDNRNEIEHYFGRISSNSGILFPQKMI